MTKITGQWKRSEVTDASGQTSTEWAAGATVAIYLIPGQEVALSKGGPAVMEFPVTTFVLDDEGRIPEGSEIMGNDCLWPEGTGYEISIDDTEDSLATVWGYRTIEGAEVDLGELNLEPFRTGMSSAWQPKPVPFTIPKLKREAPPLPAKRIRGAKYSSFVATNIYGESGDSVGPVAIGGGGSHSFYLPYPAVTRGASIFVDVVPQMEQSVTIELYSVDDDKTVCRASIDASTLGGNVGYFDEVAILNQGEYRVRWSTPGSLLRVRGVRNTKLPEICFSS